MRPLVFLILISLGTPILAGCDSSSASDVSVDDVQTNEFGDSTFDQATWE